MNIRLLPIALIAVAVGLALRAPAPGAHAHAFLARSEPAAGAVLSQSPVEVQLWFTEDIEIAFSDAQVIDGSGQRYDSPNGFHVHYDLTNPGILMQPEMGNGAYTVIWNVLSAVDGHRTKGAFSFFIGPPDSTAPATVAIPPDLGSGSPPPGWLEVFVRWFNFAGMAALIGAALFPFLVLTRGFAALRPDPNTASEPRRDSAETLASRAAAVSAIAAALVVAVASLLTLWLQLWSAGGSATSAGTLDRVISDTRFGEIWIFRIVLVTIACVSAFALLRQGGKPWQRSILDGSNSLWLLVGALAIAIPGTTSLNSHAAASGIGPVATAVDWFHLVAGGVWIGGLVQLVLVSAVVVPALEERSAFFGSVIRRFSLVAAISVAVIVATGIFQSIERLGGVGELVDTNYGTTLLVKVLLLTPLLVIAAFNLLIVGPRFVSMARSRGARALSSLWEGRFRFAVSAELALAVFILVATAILTSTSPPGPAQGSAQSVSPIATPVGSAVASQRAGDLNITLWADPGRVGVNDINVTLADVDGDERTVQRVILRLNYLEQSLGVSEIDASPFHPPVHYVANTSQLSLPGNWEVEVVVRREGLLDVRAKIQIAVQA